MRLELVPHRRRKARVQPTRGSNTECVHRASVPLGKRRRGLPNSITARADPQGAVAEVKGEGLIKSTGRMYRQDYVVFLRAAGGKIAFLREYFDPVRAARALDTPILGL